MIVFESITYQNFLSTGAVPNTVELNKHASTLITGKNGQGKSCILDALTFALFGKPFRNVNKGQLINSINGKNCLVEIVFSVNNHRYNVKRGMKPNVFEIWCDGTLLTQDAATKDYQKVLEQQILKLNYKTFTQVVIIGSASFVPFMQLPASQRRDVIEDILDIKVFSIMNTILKEKVISVRDDINQTEASIMNYKSKIEAQKKLISVLEQNRQNVVNSIQIKIDNNVERIQETRNEIGQITALATEIKSKAETGEVVEAISAANKMKVKLSTKIAGCKHMISFFEQNTTCPTCLQSIQETHKHHAIDRIQREQTEHDSKHEQISKVVESLTTKLENAREYANKLQDYNIQLSTLSNQLTTLTEQNQQLHEEMQTSVGDATMLNAEKMKIREMAEHAISLVEQKSQLLETKQLHEVASLLLKDTGIKTAIIHEYLPIMNKLINRFLSVMDFFVRFELDEAFQECIKSRGRDEFTYDSFSEGEKQKINLAVLFTWRQIAKMKNSINTNLLIMDEVLDSSLDSSGVDAMLSIFRELDKTNIFVISHRESTTGHHFDAHLNVTKRGDFSVVTLESEPNL